MSKPFIELSLPDKNKFTKLLQELGSVAVPVAAASLYAAAEAIMAKSKEEYVPVDTGALRSSGYVKAPEITHNNASVEMGFGGTSASYALAVHENPRAGKTGGLSPKGQPYESWASTGGWKYLETPLKNAITSGSISRRIGKDLERAFTQVAK